MKTRLIKEQYTTSHTVDGEARQITKTRNVPVPVVPRDWDQIALRAAFTIILALTVLTVVWSTWSIGSLLGGGIGYTTAVVFDAAWATALILEYLARYEPAKRTFPQAMGWVLLLATMGAIFWHGMELGSVAMGVVGSAVSLFAKVLWLSAMRHVHRDLDPDDAQWLAQKKSERYSQEALAVVDRGLARTEDRIAAQRLATERIRGTITPITPDLAREQTASVTPINPLTSVIADREQPIDAPSIADLAREQIAITEDNKVAVASIMAKVPTANEGSVAAAVRRERKKINAPYL